MNRRERGSATAELAACVPVVVILMLVGVSGVAAVATEVRCVDAAREGALATARGGDGAAAAASAAPPGASVAVASDGQLVTAEVGALVRPLGPHLPGFEVRGSAVAVTEPDNAP